MIEGISNPPQTQSQKSTTSLAADLDAFLLLLTTQLQHQDPLSPLEPTEFTDQLVNFASVEQQIQSNTSLEQLVALQNSSLAASVVGFIGTDVEAVGSQVALQDGEAEFTYTLSSNAKNVVITMTDAAGRVVLATAGDNAAGPHDFVWDGKDANGIQQPDGAYNLSITPVGFDDEPVDMSVVIRAHVTGVNTINGVTTLEADGTEIPLNAILSIREPKTAPEG